MPYLLIDTHCHITCDDLFNDIQGIMNRAKEQGVQKMLIICTNFSEFERAKILKKNDPVRFDIALGFHPNDLYTFQEADYDYLEALLCDNELNAIGEIGLDYHWDDVSVENQKVGFIRQIELAKKYQKPILIHMREATKDTIDILKNHGPVNGIMHCYSGSYETAEILMQLGFYISYGGPLTFKNAKGATETAMKIPLNRLFVETDCPYLTPHPFRGKKNEPMYITNTFLKLCDIKGIAPELLAEQMQYNYQTLFSSVAEDRDAF